MATDTGSSAVVVFGEDTGKAKSRVWMDSLPYVDGTNEQYEAYALATIEEEMKSFKASTKLPKLDGKIVHKSALFDTKGLSDQAEAPESTKVEITADAKKPSKDTVEAWREAVRKARAVYESERVRSVVLELEKSDASGLSWRQYGTILNQIEKSTKEGLQARKEEVELVNVSRQQHQQEAGKKLGILQAQWHERTRKRRQLLAATEALKKEIEAMK